MHKALVGILLLVVFGCGGGGSGGAGQPTTQNRPVRGPADLITEAEINTGVYQNALEIIRALRPSMLIPRGSSPTSGSTAVGAYVDDVRVSDLSGLTAIPTIRIKEIRFINARDATTRYGTGHGSGVILVTTKR